ncbi:MAG: radical SAM protein [Acidobacteria bacterium]|nr:radical SAM protein [Acidobacteriota bacterium]
MRVRLQGFEPGSRVNGPGLRAVAWFQGCSIGCPGCFNPATHASNAGYEADTAEVAHCVLASRDPIEGLTVSGGEPFEQPEALLDLLRQVRSGGLSTLVFSGYARAAIERMPLGRQILSAADVLIDGPYVQERHLARGLLGSSNQRIHLLTDRYSAADFTGIPRREAVLHRDGTVTLSGIAPLGASGLARPARP